MIRLMMHPDGGRLGLERDEPVLMVNHYAVPLARRDSWLRRLEIYDDYAESPYTRMAEVLTQMGLDREIVGFEKTYLSAARWEEIRGLLPTVTVGRPADSVKSLHAAGTPQRRDMGQARGLQTHVLPV